MNLRFFKLSKGLCGLCALMLLASCAGFNNDAWPRLDEGFDLRPDPRDIVKVEEARQGTQTSKMDESLTSDQEQDGREVAQLKADIAAQQIKYVEALALIKSAEQEAKQRHWFSAQLELSRLASLKDALASLNLSGQEGYLAELDKYIEMATVELRSANPS